MKHFGWENFSKEHVKHLFKILQSVSPVKVNSIIFVDPPKWFNSIWTIFSQFCTKETLSKINVITRSELTKFFVLQA